MPGFPHLIMIAFMTLAAAPAAAECLLPGTPAIPEGRTASKAQMIAASAAVKAYQAALIDYRGCIDREVAALGEDAAREDKEPLLAAYDDSIDLEDAIAARFNSQIRNYKARNQ